MLSMSLHTWYYPQHRDPVTVQGHLHRDCTLSMLLLHLLHTCVYSHDWYVSGLLSDLLCVNVTDWLVIVDA